MTSALTPRVWSSTTACSTRAPGVTAALIFIAAISPAAATPKPTLSETGKVTGWIDLTGLNPDPDLFVYPFVLNGVAHNPENGKLLVTGKCWPHIWEISLVPLSSAR